MGMGNSRFYPCLVIQEENTRIIHIVDCDNGPAARSVDQCRKYVAGNTAERRFGTSVPVHQPAIWEGALRAPLHPANKLT